MLDSKSSALGSRTHPVYRGVQQQGPLPGHKIGSLAAIRHKNSTESSRLVRYHKGSRDLLDPTQAPPTPVQPASHLPPGRTLRRKPRLEDIRKVYEEQVSRRASEQSLPKPEWGHSRLFSISSYGSEPVVENARVGLKTSALAAMVVDVDQGPEERAQARGTWRAFPLGSRRERRGVSRVDDAIIERRSPSASHRVDDAIVECRSPSASSREANQPPECRIGTLKNFLVLAPEVSTRPLSEAAQQSSSASSSSLRPFHSGCSREYADCLDDLRPPNRRLVVTNPGPLSKTGAEAGEE